MFDNNPNCIIVILSFQGCFSSISNDIMSTLTYRFIHLYNIEHLYLVES